MILIQFIIGTVLGSFLFASYSRLRTGGSILSPARSYCDSCSATIAWFDLVPIFSYLILRGRCRNCNQTIPLASLFCELFFGSLLLSWQPTLLSTGYVLVGCLLFFMAINDTHYLAFPTVYGHGLMLLAVTLYGFFSPHHPFFIFMMLIWLMTQFFEPKFKWIGAGDLDVFLCLLILLGFVPFAWLLLLSSLSGLVTSQFLKLRRLPFLPFITASYLIILFFI